MHLRWFLGGTVVQLLARPMPLDDRPPGSPGGNPIAPAKRMAVCPSDHGEPRTALGCLGLVGGATRTP